MSAALRLFDRVRGQVERLIPLFGLHQQEGAVLSLFDTLCRESLDIDVRHRVPEFSRINADGTPFQLSLTLSRKSPAGFHFLSEAGRPAYSVEQRNAASFAALRQLAEQCGATSNLELILPLLRRLVPKRPLDLQDSSAGILWLALSFTRDGPPALTLYVNGRWGPECGRWQRLEEMAEFFGSNAQWASIVSRAAPGLTPLGVAFTLTAGRSTTGRIYLQAFGVPLDAYRDLFLTSTAAPDAAETFEQFSRGLLREDVKYPTRSAVFSLELPAAPMAGAKFELCGHCAFKDDGEAATRISSWLRGMGVDGHCYDATLSELGFGRRLSKRPPPVLHSYVGVGMRRFAPYASVYLNPGPSLELEGE